MKYIKLEYPDDSLHNVIVTNFGYSTSAYTYFVEYYDLSQSAKMYTIIEKTNNTFIRNPYAKIDMDDLFFGYQSLDENLLPDVLECKKTYFKTARQNICIDAYKIDENYYILESICSKIKLDEYNEKKTINGTLCRKVSIETITKLNKKETEKNCYYVRIIEIKNEANNTEKEELIEKKQEEKQEIEYYNDITNNKMYITRNVYEECKKLNINSSFEPKIIDNRNCYSIEKNDLETLLNNDFKGKEIIISNEKEQKEKTKDEVIIAYQDKETKKIYIEQKYINNKNTQEKVILNKKCYEVNEKDLESILNKIIVVAPIYLKKDINNNQQVKIYNYNDIKFISEDIIKEYSIDTTYRKKIKIAGEIKYAISEQEINTIIEKANQNKINIYFINKKITPVDKNI